MEWKHVETQGLGRMNLDTGVQSDLVSPIQSQVFISEGSVASTCQIEIKHSASCKERESWNEGNGMKCESP